MKHEWCKESYIKNAQQRREWEYYGGKQGFGN
jgi:hypothetical protein